MCIWTSQGRKEGCCRVQEGSGCAESRHHGIWILIVISLTVFTLGAHECIAWDSRCFLLGTKLNVNASFLKWCWCLNARWISFDTKVGTISFCAHISVRPRALLLPVCCFQTNSCCAPVRSIKCVYHHIFRKYHYLIKTTFCANACTPMLGWNNNEKNLNTAIFVPKRNVPNSPLDRGGFIPTFDCPSH